MCGRYAIPDPGDITVRFNATRSGYDLNPRYNAAPNEDLPVVVNTGENHVELMRWGLVPFWAKDINIGYKMINARAETLKVKPSFRKALSLQRCIVPAGGFFEWRQVDKEKVPYYIFLKNKQVFGFAGLYDVWHDKEKKDEEEWLNPDESEPDKLVKLLHPYPASEMEAYPVSRLVNSPSNDTREV